MLCKAGGGEGSRPLSIAAERQRRHRQRLKAGRIPLAIEVDERVIEALLITGAISEAESLRRSAIEAALSEMVDDWTRRALVTA